MIVAQADILDGACDVCDLDDIAAPVLVFRQREYTVYPSRTRPGRQRQAVMPRPVTMAVMSTHLA
jgi:hypothetical protein